MGVTSSPDSTTRIWNKVFLKFFSFYKKKYKAHNTRHKMDSIFNTVTNASSLITKTVKDVSEVNIQDEATTVFSRAKQFTEEKLGRTERTEYDLDFQDLEKKTDLTRSYTEKIKNNTAAVIVPNPAVRAEIMFNDNVPMNKLGLKREQMTNHEYLGGDMIEAGNEFGPDTPYGSALIRVGQAEKRLGELEKEYIKSTNEGLIMPLTSFLDEEMKNVMKERKVLENKRLDLDACKSKVKKSRKDIMEQRPDDPYDARAALHQAEDELQQCQVEFASQVEVAQRSMKALSHIQEDHLKHLTAFIQAQEEYYANGHKVMQELYRDLWGENISLQNLNIEEKNGHDDNNIQDDSDSNISNKSSSLAFPSNLEVL